MRLPPLLLTAIALAATAWAPPSPAQSPADDNAGGWSTRTAGVANDASMPVAILIRNPDRGGGSPPYALADQYGQAQRFVEASPRINLDRYLGRRVHVRHDTGMTLLPSQLELPPLTSSDHFGGGDRPPRRLAAPDARPLERLAAVEPAAYTDGRTPRVASLDRMRSTTRRRGSYRMAQAGDLPGAVGDPINMGRARYEVLPGGELPPVDLPQADVTDGAAGSGEPIDLDRLLADEAGDLPPPRDDAPLEPIPAGDSYYDGGDAGAPSYRADCPECRERSVTGKPTPAAAYAGRNQPCQDCGDPWCGPSCNPASRRGPYGRVEYLLWWADGFDTPPLVTTNDVPGNAPALGQDGTRTVYGGELLDGSRNGLRLSGGYWFDDQRDLALEFDWLLLETESDLYAFSDPTGTSVLGRPFYNVAPVINGVVQPPASDAQLVSFPGTVGGDLDIYARTEFTSLGIRARTGLCCREIGGGCDPCACNGCRDNRLGGVLGVGRRPTRPDGISRVDATVGYRFARLQDHLGFRESLTDLAGGGGAVEVNEAFDTSNEFHGLDLGVVYDWQTTRWGLELVGRVALGSTEQQVRIRGENRVGVPGGAGVTTPGGLLAQTSNIGVYERDRFSVLPELSARLSYRVTPRLSLSAAYTLLYWANVVRPGDQIDFSVDGRLASGALVAADPLSHPRFDLEETSYWAHGLSFGADYRY